LRREESRLLVARLTEQSDDLDEATDGHEISDRFASVLAAEFTSVAMTLLEKETDPEKRWQRLREVHRELSQLRRDDHRAVRMTIKRERWNREVEQEEDEEHQRVQRANKDRLIDLVFAPMRNQTMAEAFGGGEYGERMAEMLHRIKFDMPLDDLLKTPSPKKTDSAAPKESELIQPNPIKNNGSPSEQSGSPA
jgi:DNA primase